MQLIVKDFVENGGASCKECNSGNVTLKAELRFFEFLSISIFPLSRTYRLVCSNCKANKITTKPVNNPISTFEFFSKFLGLLLISALVIIYWLNEQRSARIEADILSNPQVFDFYIINQQKLNLKDKRAHSYSVAKVIEVNENEVRFKIGSYSYQNERGIIKHIR
jgi:hypothetical protein